MSPDLQRLKDIVETWNAKKVNGREFTGADMRRFVEDMNATTRMLIRVLEVEYPEFYTGLMELAMNATTLTTKGARIIADGTDRTNL